MSFVTFLLQLFDVLVKLIFSPPPPLDSSPSGAFLESILFLGWTALMRNDNRYSLQQCYEPVKFERLSLLFSNVGPLEEKKHLKNGVILRDIGSGRNSAGG
jgi:hypothetical protein